LTPEESFGEIINLCCVDLFQRGFSVAENDPLAALQSFPSLGEIFDAKASDLSEGRSSWEEYVGVLCEGMSHEFEEFEVFGRTGSNSLRNENHDTGESFPIPRFFQTLAGYRREYIQVCILYNAQQVLDQEKQCFEALGLARILLSLVKDITFSSEFKDARRQLLPLRFRENIQVSVVSNLTQLKFWHESVSFAKFVWPSFRSCENILRIGSHIQMWSKKIGCTGLSVFLHADLVKSIPKDVISGQLAEGPDDSTGRHHVDLCGGFARGENRVLFKGQGGNSIVVETLAIEHYSKKGWKCLFSEGSRCVWNLINDALMSDFHFDETYDTEFGEFEAEDLLCDDELLSDWMSLRRLRALELYCEKFVTGELSAEQLWINRNAKQLKNIDESEDTFDTFERMRVEAILCVIKLLPPLVLKKLLIYAQTSWDSLDNGHPDLVLWNPAHNPPVMCVEVKSPTDSLRWNQKAQLIKLIEIGIPCRICHVSSYSHSQQPITSFFKKK
jgi:hypothetical protein